MKRENVNLNYICRLKTFVDLLSPTGENVNLRKKNIKQITFERIKLTFNRFDGYTLYPYLLN